MINYLFSSVDKKNGFNSLQKEYLKKDIENNLSIVFISSYFDNYEKNDKSKNLFISLFNKIDVKFKNIYLIDNRITKENAKNMIQESDIVFLMGGEIYNQMKNINNFGLQEYIKNKKIVIGVSAGSLNQSKNVLYLDEYKDNNINIEDIPALMYIKYKLNGSKEYYNFKHIVIDEAQDYGEFTFYVLKKIFKNSTFSIYGDLAQSLYPYRSLSNWESLKSIYKNFEILKLNKSYRTTIEIMNEANKINEILGLDKAIPVIRHGEEVEKYNKNIIELINTIKDKYKTIAIITKTQEGSNKMYEELKNNIDISLITKDNLNYNSSISIMPSYLSKGLEFDSVIIINENDFDKSSVLDMKLLYVSKTRALHKLFLINYKF